MRAASNGHSDTVKVLLEAGASIEAKDNVSKRISICLAHVCVYVCVCVIFCHHSLWYVKSVVLFYSYILLLWYVGYDDFISMNNVIVFVLMIIISLLVLSLANMKMNILEKSLFSFSDEFLYFSSFLHFIYFCISSMYIFLINYCFSFFLFSSVFIFSQTLILFYLFPSLSQSLYDNTRFDMIWFNMICDSMTFVYRSVMWYEWYCTHCC